MRTGCPRIKKLRAQHSSDDLRDVMGLLVAGFLENVLAGGGQIQPVEAFNSTSSVNNSEGFFQL